MLVTGATDGIGKATARRLAEAGATVIVHGRDEAKVRRTVDDVGHAAQSGRVEGVTFDLASLASVRQGAAQLLARHPVLHVLVNNAGVISRQRKLSADGIELTFQVNHLAPFLLTELLLPALRRGVPARIVNVSSQVHRGATLPMDDLQSRHGYSGHAAYGLSKLANVLHANALARRLQPHEITANSLHPGVIATNLLRDGWGGGFGSGDVDAGADTSIYLALSPDVEGVSGRYFDRCREAPASPLAADPALQDALWAASAKLVGL